MESSDNATTRVITGYEVFRFGVSMIGRYVNKKRGNPGTISPAVPGAQYRITAWALGGRASPDNRRSEAPAVSINTTEEASELKLRH